MLSAVRESVSLKQSFFEDQANLILEICEVLATALGNGKKLLIFGNGGSAADAQHFAAELVNRFITDRSALPAISLTTDGSILTSISNDVHFETVFSRQIEALGAEGDIAFAITTSGNSHNVLNAVKTAQAKNMKTIALSGRDGGAIANSVAWCLTVPHQETARVQEVHAMLIHLFCQAIEDSLFAQ